MGLRKVRRTIEGHQDCGTCHPFQKNGPARARREDKRMSREEEVCAECEGTGSVRVHRETENMAHRMLWHTKEKDEPSDDGHHELPCLACILERKEA